MPPENFGKIANAFCCPMDKVVMEQNISQGSAERSRNAIVIVMMAMFIVVTDDVGD